MNEEILKKKKMEVESLLCSVFSGILSDVIN